MVIFSNCKINIGLNVIAKRGDGFHNIETLFYPIPFYDVIEIIQATTFQFTSTGLPINGTIEDNLCVKAYHLVKQDFANLPNVHIHLQKNIPMGAGIGGGSANAAYTLQLLNNKFALNLTEEQLLNYATKLGSDCAFFIKNTPCRATGRGELLTPFNVDLSNYTIALLFPKIHISTKDAFANLQPKLPSTTLAESLLLPIHQWKNVIANDFEKTVFLQHPVLKTYKESLHQLGALYASMSGSGSTIYGIFEKGKINGQVFQEKFTEVDFKLI